MGKEDFLVNLSMGSNGVPVRDRSVETAHPGREVALRYGIAVAAVAVAFIARFVLASILKDQAPYLFLLPAVLLAAGVGGFGPGILATCSSVPLVFFFIANYGAVGWSEVANGAVFVLIGVGTAWIGERLRQARILALTREAHLQSIIDIVPEATIVIDGHGIIQSFSATAEQMFGYTAAEAIGNNVTLLMPSPYREEHDGSIKRYRDTGVQRVIGTGRMAAAQRKDGSTFPMELAVGEIWSASQRFFTGFIRDLTERQGTEARLQELQSELAHVSRLTEMGGMASAIAHELNQPLAAIANYLKGSRRLLDGSTDERLAILRDAMDSAADQALRAGQIIRRMREFVSRRESERQIQSIAKLVEEASALALVGAKDRGVGVTFEFDPRVNLILADKVQIQQVLVNLIRNAVEAMEESSERSLTVRTTPADNMMIVVQVDDSGSGISEEMATKLFQPFATTKPHGMGVGLSISRTIVEAHGGQIKAEPRPGGGTRFRFTLPAVTEEEFTDARR
jgi:two-component system sensor kinase FixL